MSRFATDGPGLPVVPARVRLGAELLDRVEPGWARRIDLATLDSTSVTGDVLGQLWGDWFAGVEGLWPGYRYGQGGGLPARHGLDIARSGDPWGPLDSAWRAEVARRVEEGGS